MTRVSVFSSPLLLGFEHFERVVDSVSKASADGYPPYNIEQTAADAIRISIAVAGFALGDLEITVEDNQLVVRGRQPAVEEDRVFLHRGIAGRQFQRRFVLADGIEVESAGLENGLLHVDLRRPEPANRTRRIEIENRDGLTADGNVAESGRMMIGEAAAAPK